MSVMTSFTLRSLAKNRVRTVVSVAGIALSCALFVAVALSVVSVQNALYVRTVQIEGAWHAFASDVSEEGAAELEDSDQVTNLIEAKDFGTAPFTEAERRTLGEGLSLRTLPTVVKGSDQVDGMGVAPSISLAEGSLPDAPGEIALPLSLQGQTLAGDRRDAAWVFSEGPLEVGSAVTVAAGTRLVDTGSDAGFHPITSFSSELTWDYATATREPYPCTYEDVQVRTFTVTGFYTPGANVIGSTYEASGNSAIGLVVDDGSQAISRAFYLTTQGFATLADLDGFLYEIDAVEGVTGVNAVSHQGLLRYLGIVDQSNLVDGLWMIAGILAVVVLIASVSLVRNSFAISVAERTRQFGLLSSLGASRRQIRSSVLFEALVLGGIGVPLGMVLGVAGTSMVFAFTQDALSEIIGAPLRVVVSAVPLALGAVLSFVAVFASAFSPAVRASRVSAVEAIRQTREVRLTRRAVRAAARASAKDPERSRGLAGRLFGVPGFVAHRNLSRSSSRGRTVVASLAMSVALVIIAGSASAALDALAEIPGNKPGAESSADVVVSLIDTQGESLPFSDEAEDGSIEGFIEDATQIEGVGFAGVVVQGQTGAVVPAAMISSEGRSAREAYDAQTRQTDAGWLAPSFAESGNYAGDVSIFYVDDATWARLCDEAGVDAASTFEKPRAIGINEYRPSIPDAARYTVAKQWAETGAVRLYAQRDLDGYSRLSVREAADGTVSAAYLSYEAAIHDTAPSGPEATLMPVDEYTEQATIEVAGLLDECPPELNIVAATNQYLALVMPLSVSTDAVAAVGSQADTNPFSTYFADVSFTAEDHEAAAEAIEDLADRAFGVEMSTWVSDVTGSALQYRMMSQALRLFGFCFAVILVLIAVANVFNTLSNSIMLRTREFAMLKSVGMGDAAFARMLGYECASYALRGLVIGLVLAALVEWGLYQAMSIALSNAAFALPWDAVVGSVAMVFAVLGLSVAFALHRSRAANVVEALRQDTL